MPSCATRRPCSSFHDSPLFQPDRVSPLGHTTFDGVDAVQVGRRHDGSKTLPVLRRDNLGHDIRVSIAFLRCVTRYPGHGRANVLKPLLGSQPIHVDYVLHMLRTHMETTFVNLP